jgi:hypothetical protein
MMRNYRLALLALSVLLSGVAPAEAAATSPDADGILAKVVEADPFGLAGAEISARIVVSEPSGSTRTLAFDAKSRRHDASLGRSMITFRAPADVAGMRFLQVQNKESDDERYLYTPDLKRSRRVAGSSRGDSFMGTDFSYADLDARELRNGKAKLVGEETVGKALCWRLDVTPRSPDAVYGHLELWVREDNHMPLKWVIYDRAGKLQKTLVARELRRTGDRWFVTASRMTQHGTGRSTDLLLERVTPKNDIPIEAFSLRALERG